jgi:hypothetical protein
MAHPAGESNGEALRLDFDRRVMLQFRGSVVTSDVGLLADRKGISFLVDRFLELRLPAFPSFKVVLVEDF